MSTQTHHPTASQRSPDRQNTTDALTETTQSDRSQATLARGLFGLLLVFHLWGVSVGWNSGLLQGNEFRQSQTAVTTLFVQREHNFSLAYPTPVLGKPWSIPMEFPLYQWTVSVVSSVSGLPLIQGARAVSAICLYLTLPALWLLLKRLQLPPSLRWIALGAMLTCPLYVFYARAFLIETMALMFSVWFLQGFVASVAQRSLFWLLVANMAGVGAGLVKVTTFMLYLLPAAVAAAAWMWHSGLFHTRAQSKALYPLQTIGYVAGCLAIPFLATRWWIHIADAIKALNPSGAQLVSSSMSSYHFGTWATRLSAEPWLAHWSTLTTNLAPAGSLVIVLGLTLAFGGRWRKWILATSLLFVVAPLTFPILYAWHEYYFVANGVFLMMAFGLALAATLQSTAPRWLAWILVLGLHATQIWGYLQNLYPDQRLPYEGGSGLTRLIHDVTDPNDVLVIAGNDWSSVIPFYAERRALMIRTNLDRNGEYLRQAFANIGDESVPVLILVGDMRGNQALLDHVSQVFNIDPAPFLLHKHQTIYVSRAWREEYARRLFNVSYNDVTFANPAERNTSNEPQPVSALRSTQFFACMNPPPVRYQVPFGLTFGYRPDGSRVFDAHAPTRLWFKVPAQAKRLTFDFGIIEEAYRRAGERTDGVEFAVIELLPENTERVLFSRVLNPLTDPAHRTPQQVELAVELPAGAEIIFDTRAGPSGSNAFDWSFWSKIEIH